MTHLAELRAIIADIRRAFLDLPNRPRRQSENAEIAAIEELGQLSAALLSMCPPDVRDETRNTAARVISAFKEGLEREALAGSKWAARMLLTVFADRGSGAH